MKSTISGQGINSQSHISIVLILTAANTRKIGKSVLLDHDTELDSLSPFADNVNLSESSFRFLSKANTGNLDHDTQYQSANVNAEQRLNRNTLENGAVSRPRKEELPFQGQTKQEHTSAFTPYTERMKVADCLTQGLPLFTLSLPLVLASTDFHR